MSNEPKWEATDLTKWAAENSIWVNSGCIDARNIIFKLPEGIMRCYACGGNGKYRQRYCDAGTMQGSCDSCDAMGFMYSATSRGVPKSVVNQIAVANDLKCRAYDRCGLDWSRP
jgi:hypothetical protein